ncbi:MAG: glycosyltransferase [Flavobacteriia bacterium]|jgi:dolichyl-phosphate beta-glucosyltransferase
MPNVSIIIPAYKSSSALRNNLPYLMSYIKEKNLDAEVLIVDDGSADDGATEQVAKSNSCTYLSYTINLGKGGAVRYGMQHASGDFCIFTDVDIPFEKDAFERFLYYLDFKEFDVVIGDRTLPGSSYFAEVSGLRKFGSNIFSFIVGRFVAGGHFDTQCGVKGFRGEVARDLFSVGRINGFAFDVELLYISLKRNYDIKRLPVVLRCQEGSTVSVVRHGLGMVMDLFRIKWNHVNGRYNKH